MSRLPIRLYGDPVLQARTQAIDRITAETKRLAEDMFETMDAARGVGLAANQVGVPERLTVVSVPGEREEDPPFRAALVNPAVTASSGEQIGEEGCLSFPGLYFDVRRSLQVTVAALDLEGRPVTIQAEGYLARALQHEIDHLDGVLYIDRIGTVKRGLLRNKLAEIRKRGAAGEMRTTEEEVAAEE